MSVVIRGLIERFFQSSGQLCEGQQLDLSRARGFRALPYADDTSFGNDGRFENSVSARTDVLGMVWFKHMNPIPIAQ